MIHLLDANVLIALADSNHPHRAAACRFFQQSAIIDGWATCLLTENTFLRVLGGATFPGGFGSPVKTLPLLHSLRAAPGHQFWSDDLSLGDTRYFPTLPASRHLTDIYLLALAVKHGGRFATFVAGIEASLIPGGPAAYFLIPT